MPTDNNEIQWGTPITRVKDGNGIFHKIDYYSLEGVEPVRTCDYTNDYGWHLMEAAESYFMAQIISENTIFMRSSTASNALVSVSAANKGTAGTWKTTTTNVPSQNTKFYLSPIDFINLCLRGIPYEKSPYFRFLNESTSWDPIDFVALSQGPDKELQYFILDNQPSKIGVNIGVTNKSSIYTKELLETYLTYAATVVDGKNVLPGDIIVLDDFKSFAIVAADGQKAYFSEHGAINPIRRINVATLIQENRNPICYHFGEPSTYEISKGSNLITPARLLASSEGDCFFKIVKDGEETLTKNVGLSLETSHIGYSLSLNYSYRALNSTNINLCSVSDYSFESAEAQSAPYIRFTEPIKLPAGNYQMECSLPDVYLRAVDNSDSSTISNGPSFQLAENTDVAFYIYTNNSHTSAEDNTNLKFLDTVSLGTIMSWATPYTSLGTIVYTDSATRLKHKYLRIYFHNLPLNRNTVKLKLYMASKSGDKTKTWRHPVDGPTIKGSVPQEKVLGYAQLAEHQRAFSLKNGAQYPPIGDDKTMNTRAYILQDKTNGLAQTEWELSKTDIYRGYIDIDYAKWLMSLVKPVPIVNKEMLTDKTPKLMSLKQMINWLVDHGFGKQVSDYSSVGAVSGLITKLKTDTELSSFFNRYNITQSSENQMRGIIWDWKPRVPQFTGARGNWDWAHPIQMATRENVPLKQVWTPVKIENLNFYFALEIDGIDAGYSINTLSIGGAYNDNGKGTDGDSGFEYTQSVKNGSTVREYDFSRLAKSRIYMRIY